MIDHFKYKPWIQSQNMRLSYKRLDCCDTNVFDNAITQPNNQEQTWKCFDYAIHKITGNTKPLQLNHYSNNTAKMSFKIENHFEQIPAPEPGSLAIYTKNNRINHFAYVHNYTTFESKWGNLPIYQHHPFDVPIAYGNQISFWTLKSIFSKQQFDDDIDSFSNQVNVLQTILTCFLLGGLSGFLVAEIIKNR